MNTKKLLTYAALAAGGWFVWQQMKGTSGRINAAESNGSYTDQNGTKNPFVNWASQVRNYFAIK